MPTYTVRDSVLSLKGQGRPEGTVLTSEDLEGIDIERLLKLGSIVQTSGEEPAGKAPEPEAEAAEVSEESSSTEPEDSPADELRAMTKAQIYDLALKAGATAKDLKGLKKDDLIRVVIAAWDAAAQTQGSPGDEAPSSPEPEAEAAEVSEESEPTSEAVEPEEAQVEETAE